MDDCRKKVLCLLSNTLSRRGIFSRAIFILLFLAVAGSCESLPGSQRPSLVPATGGGDIAPHVLVLFSYHRAEWSDNVLKGIASAFTAVPGAVFFYEYMDTKRLQTPEYFKTLSQIYREKYGRERIDLVICVDNNALDLVVKNPRTLFPGVPVVFCGINDYSPALRSGRSGVTGVVEFGDFSETLKIAFKARPNAKKLFVINDHTETGELNTRDLLHALTAIAPGMDFVLTDRLSLAELSATLRSADPAQVAFFVSFWKDGQGINIQPLQLETLFRNSSIPVFGRSEWMLNHGMVGGKCVTGFAQGQAAAKMALQILGGTDVAALPVDTNSPNQFIFDFKMIRHYSIPVDILPKQSILINRPAPFYRIAKPFAVAALVLFLLLCAALFLLAVNIRHRRLVESALRESESRYRGMIENIQDVFYRTDNQGNLIFINPAGAELLGYDSPEEMIGRPSDTFWMVPDKRRVMMETLEKQGSIRDYEIMMVRKDGSPVSVSTSSSHYLDTDGNRVGTEGVFRDITERKRAEAKLLAERQYLVNIIDSLPDATFLIDTDKRVVIWNRAAEKMTGFSREKLLAKGEYAYAVPFYGRQCPILIDLLSTPKEEWRQDGTYTNIKKLDEKIYGERFSQILNDGKGAYLLGAAAPLYDGKGIYLGAVEVIKDITEFRQSEKANFLLQEQLLQSQKLESIGRLAGGVAHDFNNMLGVILGHAEMAQELLDTKHPLYMNLEEIRKAAERSADITRQLLAYARKQNIMPRIIDLNDSVAGMLTMLRRLIGENVQLTWRPGENIGPINMDPSQLSQILTNLFVNARDSIADTGKIVIETGNATFDEEYCRSHPEILPGEYVLLAVSDSGCGMDDETLDHLFEPFYTTKEMGRGTGLGLAMVYGIVKQNHGCIDVFSEKDQGTTFRIHLPRCTATAAETDVKDPQKRDLRGSETILLVEDESMILDMTTALLRRYGYTVLPACSPKEALLVAEESAGGIHLLITDVVMPEMNGKEMAAKLLAFSPHLKCLFMSGYTDNVIARHGIIDNKLKFIQKPFETSDLVAKIREVLDENRE